MENLKKENHFISMKQNLEMKRDKKKKKIPRKKLLKFMLEKHDSLKTNMKLWKHLLII